MAEAWGGIFVMRCSMLRLRAAGVSLTGENTRTMNAGDIHARFIAAFSFHALRHSGGGPVSGDHPVSGRLRSERHGRTTVAGPTRKLWFQDRRWPESCQGGPEKRRLSGGKERFASSLPVPSGFVEVFPLPAEAFFPEGSAAAENAPSAAPQAKRRGTSFFPKRLQGGTLHVIPDP